jgi:hypothetical protein
MKAQELRIGNLVYSKEYKKVVKVCLVGKESIDVELNAPINNCITHYKPIPLTEEWLLKLGFKKQANDHFNLSNCFKVLIIEDYAHIQWCGIPLRNSGKIQHIHQLQNLFYSLTNSELL